MRIIDSYRVHDITITNDKNNWNLRISVGNGMYDYHYYHLTPEQREDFKRQLNNLMP